MNTVKIFSYCFLFGAILFFSACESQLQSIAGEYSFKISGQIVKDATDKISLPDEMGAMEIVHVSDSTFLLTFNTINGSAYTTQAVLSNNQLELRPFLRTITLTYTKQGSGFWGEFIEFTETEYYNTEVYGYGTIYDKTIEFKLQYLGEELTSSKKITGNNILMLAKKS